MAAKLYGALDLGSNTFRLILAQASRDGRGPDPVTKRVWQEIPRISEGLMPGKPFMEEPLARARMALDGFAGTLASEAPERLVAGCTMAARLASDGPDFAREVSRRFGCESLVLTGQEEGALAAMGALMSLDPVPARSVVFDIGGRSTEFVCARGPDSESVTSLPIGVVALSDTFMKSDPPTPAEIAAMDSCIREHLKDVPEPAGGRDPATLIGTAGTVTTLAAMLLGLNEYRPSLVHGSRHGLSAVEKLNRDLSRESVAERALRPGLHPRRADVIVAGIALVQCILERYDAEGFIASDSGLLEGLWTVASGMASLGIRT
ncbi:MAG: hypothetical protein LBT40_14255 [Deltaproteobacteria bacterium]|jgi:exopolyphosphatase/guanosine-5'-triphosphate,3'-diphosphate pyrophosphatase|nr:hypothetical protein [Deltaproteobacteria bacterium]